MAKIRALKAVTPDSVEQALGLCADAHALYLAAPADMRRMLNQAVFSELRVRETNITGIYTGGFAALRGSSLTEELAAEERRREARHDVPLAIVRSWEMADTAVPAFQQGQGSEYATLVEHKGFEPLTSCVRCRRASRTAPMPLVIDQFSGCI